MEFTTQTVISQDGTPIGYRQVGKGPGLIICHGAGRISQNYEKLALALADSFTVYLPDRRGRGLSGPEGEGYGIQKAKEDLLAVMQATAAPYIFGHSAGGLIALETMLVQPVKKLAVYEPPISLDRSFPLDWLGAFEQALVKGKRKKALAISLKGLRPIPEMGKMPLGLLQLMVQAISLLERKKAKGTRMLDLLHTMPADIRMVQALDSTYEKFKALQMPVSLMAGAKSADYFHKGIHALAAVLPHHTLKIFDGFDHYSPEEKVVELGGYLKGWVGKYDL